MFLDHHRLAHTPDHYAFGHAYLNGDDDQFRGRIDTAIDGGVRLTEDEVQRLRPSIPAHDLAPELDHITLRVLDVVGDAMAVTSDLSRELVTASAQLLDETSGQAVGALLATMVDRAEHAEARFAKAAQRARQIRTELAALQNAGNHDPLTGVTNRAAFEMQLESNAGHPLCLAFVDLDGLRGINDSHSPAVGDRLLKVVARALTDHCRGHRISRWDGGTFAVLIDTLDLRAAGAMIGDLCEAIGQRVMRVRENDQPIGRITLTAGVVATRGRSPQDLIAAAQHQLRLAKQSGKGQVCVEDTMVDVTASR